MSQLDSGGRGRRRRARVVAAALVAALCAIAADARDGQGQANRVIVLGFDGADARTIRELIDKGQLPHLAKLAQEGTFAPLATVDPAESANAWASLNTGQNSAKTGIPGFVKRVLETDFSGQDNMPEPAFGHLVGPEAAPIESFAHT